MATIVENIVGDRAIDLGREELVRKLNFGSNWTQLRVAIWCSVPGVLNISNAQLAIGVCHGTTNTYRTASSDDALVVTFGPAEATWTYSAGPPSYYVNGSSGIGIVQRIGTSTTTGSIVNSQARMSASALCPVLYAVDFIKQIALGTGFVRWSGYCRVDNNIWSGTAPTMFSRYVAADYQRSWSGGVVQIPFVASPGSQFNSFNYSGIGDWDSVTVSWTHDSPVLEINNLIAVRFSS